MRGAHKINKETWGYGCGKMILIAETNEAKHGVPSYSNWRTTAMNSDVYQRLTSRFENGGGTPLTPGKNEPLTDWLRYWLTEEETGFLLYLPMLHETPANLSTLAEKTGMTEEDTGRMLETLVEKTMAYDMDVPSAEGEVRFFALSQIFFFAECYLNRYYDDNLDSPDEIHARLGRWFEDVKKSEKLEPKAKFFRTIPIAKAVKDTRGTVATYEATKMIEETTYVCVLKCLCRSSSHLTGEPCEYPLEVCFGLGEHARRYVERSFGREVTKEWAVKTIKECEEMGLCHSVDNIEGSVSVLCNCCPCHCIPLTGYKMADQAARSARSEFVNTVDLDKCVGSGECVEKCPYGALELVSSKARVKEHRCVGCGLCAAVCPAVALSLKELPMEKRDKIYGSAEEYVADMAD
jgi:electron transport complex protein RnfB